MEIENILCPNRNVLKITDEVATAEIVDQSLDTLKCTFQNDDGVEIDTTDFNCIELSYDNLETLMDLIIQAKEYYENNLI